MKSMYIKLLVSIVNNSIIHCSFLLLSASKIVVMQDTLNIQNLFIIFTRSILNTHAYHFRHAVWSLGVSFPKALHTSSANFLEW